jgi:hypothetical protein
MRKRILAPALLAAALATSGCVVSAGLAIPLGPPVVIAHGHAHSAHCGHYRHGGRWYHSQGHRHGKNCGHKLRGGVWILVR